jgi:hypothetical protein
MSNIVNQALAVANAKDPSPEQMRAHINKFSKMIATMTEGVAKDNWHLVLMGEAGQGKTQTVVDTLKNKKVKWTGIKGTTSAIGLYKFFFDHRDHNVIVIDDSDAIYDLPEATEMLKAAMDSKAVRKISWAKQNTNLQALGIPSSFRMTARVILITNKDLEVDPSKKRISKAQRLMKPVMDRAPKFKTGLPTRAWEIEYFKMMYENNEIICFKERKMGKKAQSEIIQFVIDNNQHFGSLSFRLLDKMCAYYKNNKDTWKELSMMTLT